MSVEIRVIGDRESEALLDLLVWLKNSEGLAGRIEAITGTAEPTTMSNGIVELLVAAVASRSTVKLVTQCIAAWLRQRTSDVTVSLTSEGTKFEVTSKAVKKMSAAELQSLIETAANTLDGKGK